MIDDGSDDETAEICLQHNINVISHKYQKGNGAAIKTGIRNASGDIIAFMDADGQHVPEDLVGLLSRLNEGYDMVVGARAMSTHAGTLRMAGNYIYNKLASWVTGHVVLDLTSGFRVAYASKLREFIHMLPNGFSCPTTTTMAFFRSGYSVSYVPIKAETRAGKSHIRLLRDGLKFLLIIFRVAAFYSPLKIFFPLSTLFFITGVGYYLFTYITEERFTNMGVFLLTISILIFLIGLLAEQITFLIYRDSKK